MNGLLFPVNVDDVVPSPFTSADAADLAIGEDSQDYLAKYPTPAHPEHAAVEALGYRLSAACGLAVPVGVILNRAGAPWAFGSRIEGGVTQYTRMSAQDREDALKQCAPWLSALCALDLFLSNPDRHADNALYRRSPIDNRWTFLAMDFSRAFWHGGFPTRSCAELMAVGNTATTIAWLKFYNLWDTRRAGTVPLSLLSITPDSIAARVNELPAAWRNPNVDALASWWASAARTDRINELTGLL